MSEKETIVEIKGLKKIYSRTVALNDISLNIQRGKIIGLLGPNGSGKSTLLKAICGLVKPSSGKILINGMKPSVKTKHYVSYLPEIDHLYSWMTVREMLDFIASFYNDWSRERTEELLEFMGLDREAGIRNLSKGMRARLKLVTALARNAELVLLDEPLSGIDPPSRNRILQSIVSEYRVGEQTIVLSTHEVLSAESVFEDVIFLNKGQVKLYDSAENLRARYGSSIEELWEEVFEKR